MQDDNLFDLPIVRTAITVIRPDLRAIASGSKTAAALLSALQIFTKTAIKAHLHKHGIEAELTEEVFWVEASAQRLIDFLGGGFSPRAIRDALAQLKDQGFLDDRSPNSACRIKSYRLNIDAINTALSNLTWRDLAALGISEEASKALLPQPAKMPNGKSPTGKNATWKRQKYQLEAAKMPLDLYEDFNKDLERGLPPSPPEAEPTLPAETDRTPEPNYDSEPRSNSTPVKSESLCAKPGSSSRNSGGDHLPATAENFSRQNRTEAATSPRHPAARMEARFERLTGQDGAAAHRRECDRIWPALVAAGLELAWVGPGRSQFSPAVLESARKHLAKHDLPADPADCKRFISNRIRAEDWVAVELLMESGENAIATPARQQPEPIMAAVRVDPRFLDKLKPA